MFVSFVSFVCSFVFVCVCWFAVSALHSRVHGQRTAARREPVRRTADGRAARRAESTQLVRTCACPCVLLRMRAGARVSAGVCVCVCVEGGGGACVRACARVCTCVHVRVCGCHLLLARGADRDGGRCIPSCPNQWRGVDQAPVTPRRPCRPRRAAMRDAARPLSASLHDAAASIGRSPPACRTVCARACVRKWGGGLRVEG